MAKMTMEMQIKMAQEQEETEAKEKSTSKSKGTRIIIPGKREPGTLPRRRGLGI